MRPTSMPFTPGFYRSVKRIVINNIVYIANLTALYRWYRVVRARFISRQFPETLHEGLLTALQSGMDERIRRLGDLAEKMPESIEIYKGVAGDKASKSLIQQKNELYQRRLELSAFLAAGDDGEAEPEIHDRFLRILDRAISEKGKDYLGVIQSLEPEDAAVGIDWLQGMVDRITAHAMARLPSFHD
jgi:UDP-N-acetylglucosamine/UDP-N-acetylgalactosamine diphosphorylase